MIEGKEIAFHKTEWRLSRIEFVLMPVAVPEVLLKEVLLQGKEQNPS